MSRLGKESVSSRDEEESSVSLPASPTSLSLALSSSYPLGEPSSHGKKTNWGALEEGKSATEPVGTLEEMEVTRKMSSLTFAMAMGMYRDRQGFSGVTSLEAGLAGIMREPPEEGLSETELCSELASATQLDLLPTLSDRELGQECMEGLEMAQRRARKRPSRRKPTRRTKKQRSVVIVTGSGCDRASSPKVVRGMATSSLPAIYHPLSQKLCGHRRKKYLPFFLPLPQPKASPSVFPVHGHFDALSVQNPRKTRCFASLATHLLLQMWTALVWQF